VSRVSRRYFVQLAAGVAGVGAIAYWLRPSPSARHITVRRLLTTADVADGWHVAAVTVGPQNDPVVLCSEKPLGFDEVLGAAGFAPRSGSAESTRLRVHHLRDGILTTIVLPEIEPAMGFQVQPVSLNRWLVIRDADVSHNAYIYSADGRLLRTWTADGGIADVQTTEDEQIWVSYFDEGIYRFGSPGDAGLVCFTPDGEPLARFNSDFHPPLPPIDDCYALNVASSRDTWLYYYSAFPLVKLANRAVDAVWDMPVHGAGGFAVSGSRVIFAGSYQARDRIYLLSLDTMDRTCIPAPARQGAGAG
jgi:hypothetical protein